MFAAVVSSGPDTSRSSVEACSSFASSLFTTLLKRMSMSLSPSRRIAQLLPGFAVLAVVVAASP